MLLSDEGSPISFVLRARHSRSAIPSLSLLIWESRKRAISGSADRSHPHGVPSRIPPGREGLRTASCSSPSRSEVQPALTPHLVFRPAPSPVAFLLRTCNGFKDFPDIREMRTTPTLGAAAVLGSGSRLRQGKDLSEAFRTPNPE